MSLGDFIVRLKDNLDYNPDTGVFLWKKARGRVRAGSEAGTIKNRGKFLSSFRTIRFEGRYYTAHKLAWLIIHNCWPVRMIIFLNRNRHDLRQVNMVSESLGINVNEIRCAIKVESSLRYYGYQVEREAFA